MPVRVFIAHDPSRTDDEVVLTLDACATLTVVGPAQTPRDSIEGILAAYPRVVVRGNTAAPADRNGYLCAGTDDFLDKRHEFSQLAHAVVRATQHAAY